jgi:hypothetical protein
MTQKVHLHQWPLSAQTPTPLATITYNPLNGHATFASYSPPPPPPSPDDNEIIRVGVLTAANSGWAGTVTDKKSLGDASRAAVTLWLDERGDVWRVEFFRNASVRPPSSLLLLHLLIGWCGQATKPTVRTVRSAPGPIPVLNRPVVLTPEGKIPEAEVEKTFLQK